MIIGCYMLLALAAVVFSVWALPDKAVVTKSLEPGIIRQSQMPDSSDHAISPDNPTLPALTNTALRYAEFGCAAPACTLSCDVNERLANAFVLSPGGTISYESERSVTVKPARVPSSKIILVCAGK